MVDRKPSGKTGPLEAGWKLQIIIDDKVILLDIADTMLIGRSVEGDDPGMFALDLSPFSGYESGVSRQHATISHHEGALYVEDHASTNGTRINGFQLTAHRKYRLRDGDEVEFARLRVVFHFVGPGD